MHGAARDPLDWSLSRQPVEEEDPLAVTLWTAAPRSPHWSAEALAWAPARARERVMNSGGGMDDRAEAAMTRCRQVTPDASDDAADSTRTPPGLTRLARAWGDTLVAASAGFGSLPRYHRCMTRQRIPLLHGRPYDAQRVYEQVLAAVPPDELVPIGHARPSAQWRRFLAVERTVTDADWACRRDGYATGLRSLIPVINAFAARHEAAVTRLEASWRRGAATATRLPRD